MKDITEAIKENNGIRLRISSGESVLFSFKDLIKMEINAFHLLQYPGKYAVDISEHRIIRKRHGQ